MWKWLHLCLQSDRRLETASKDSEPIGWHVGKEAWLPSFPHASFLLFPWNSITCSLECLKKEDQGHLFNVTINMIPGLCPGWILGRQGLLWLPGARGEFMSMVLSSVIQETHSRWTKQLRRSVVPYFTLTRWNCLLDKEFIAGRNRLLLSRMSN